MWAGTPTLLELFRDERGNACRVIEGFSCKETEKIWKGGLSKNLPGEIQERANLAARFPDKVTEMTALLRKQGDIE